MRSLHHLVRMASCLWACQASAWLSEDKDPSPHKSHIDLEQLDLPYLLPSVHWDHPVHDLHNLKPVDSHDLYFSSQGISDSRIQHTFASVSMTLTHLAVVLDHTSLISAYSCTPSHILVEFASREAFEYASEHWSAASTELSLITYAEGCHGDSTEQRTFWKVNELFSMSDSLAISAAVEYEMAFEDALHEIEFSWGTHDPLTVSHLSARQTTNATGSVQNCGAAPASALDGLPAAACGDSNFDRILDDAIGYYDWSPSQYPASLQSFLPNVKLDALNLKPDPYELVARSNSIRKRGFYDSLTNFAVSTAAGAAQIIGGATQAVGGVLSGLNTINTAAGNLLADAVTGVLGTERYAVSTTPPPPVMYGGPTTMGTELFNSASSFMRGPTKDFDTPLGPAATIFSAGGVMLACVNCGASANTRIIGRAAVDVSSRRVTVLTTTLGLNFQAGLNIGVAASGQVSKTASKTLTSQALPGLGISIAKIVTAGVSLDISAVAQLDVQAQGQAIAGVSVSLPDFAATLDLINPALSSVTGSPPVITRNLNVAGQINTNAQLSLPISLVLGLKIPIVTFERSVSITEEPSIIASVAVFAGTSSNPTCPNGAAYSINFANKIYFSASGTPPYTKSLANYQAALIPPGCFRSGLSARSSSEDVPRIKGRVPILEARQTNMTVFDNSTMTTILSEGEPMFVHDPADTFVPNNNPVYNFTTNPDNPQLQALYAQALASAASATNSDGTSYATIVDLHSQFVVLPGADGNMYAGNFTLWTSDGTGLFAQTNSSVIRDVSGRVLHYFPDEMNAYNASRLRIANQTDLPQGSVVISLTWLDWDPSDSTTPMLYMPVDSRLNIYNPVMCNFSNGAPSKIFIANGQSGLNSLQNNYNTEFTITGAPVANCWPLALVPGMMN